MQQGMKLTKDERYTAYCIMLEEAENKRPFKDIDGNGIHPTVNGLCWMFLCLFDSNLLYHFSSRILPELYTKIERHNEFHFYSWRSRIAALKQCIKETENF